MKIAIDIREAIGEKTGKGHYAANLIREVLDLDRENEYFLYSDTRSGIFGEHANVTSKVISKKGFLWHYSVLRDVYKEEIDVFFAPTSYIIPALANRKKIKIVMTVHDLVAFLFPSKHNKKAVFIEKVTLKRALKRVSAAVCVSQNTKNDLIDLCKIDDEKVYVIPNAASDNFKPLSDDVLASFRGNRYVPDKYIFAAATLEPRKNFPFLLRSFSKVQKEFPGVKLLIAGKKGWYYDEIFKTVEELDLGDKVEFLGYVDEEDLPKYYNCATFFVYPSLYEGFGLQPLEAMQCGCPVICSNTSSLPEVVGDASTAINPRDENSLTKAMKQLLKDKTLREKLAEKGFSQSKKFSWRESAKRLIDLLKGI